MPEFSPEELAAEAATAETPAAVEPPAQERPRDEAGRFAPAEREEGAEPAQPPAEGDRSRMVPHAALHAEREGRKADRAELAAAKARLAQIDELRQRIAAPPAAAPAPVVPSVATPSVEGQAPPAEVPGLAHLQQQLDNLQRARDADVQHQNLAAIDQHETQLITAEVHRSDAEFTARQPDYPMAVQHLVQSRARELQRYGHDAASIHQIIQDEALELSKTAIQLGMSPAEMAYQVAQDRGWAGATTTQAAPQNEASRMLDAIAAGQKGSKSLGAMSGGAPASQIGADAIGQMTEAEFARLYETPEGRALIDSMG